MEPKFISHPDFANLEPYYVYHKSLEQKEFPHPQELMNRHIIYRKKASFGNFKKAVLKISADDYYKLYINGRYVTEGPAQAYHMTYLYNELDVTPWLQPGEKFCEPHVLELSNGTLLGSVRVEGRVPFTIATGISKDGGETWSEFVCTDVSGAPPHLLEHSSGAIICTFGRREPPYGEYAIVSHDKGATWAEEYIIDDNTDSRDLGYGSTVELADGSLLSVYYQRCPGDNYPSLLYTKWKL